MRKTRQSFPILKFYLIFSLFSWLFWYLALLVFFVWELGALIATLCMADVIGIWKKTVFVNRFIEANRLI